MRELVLKKFFAGEASAHDLAEDLAGALVRAGENVTNHPIVDMSEDFVVTSSHLVRVCDAVLAGVVAPDRLQAVGFCLAASDRFEWDAESAEGEVVAETVHDWSAPAINYPLTLPNVAAFRARLAGLPRAFQR